jgi:hypothetical protein
MYVKPSQTSERKNILRRGVLRGLNVSTHGKPTGPRYHSNLAESAVKSPFQILQLFDQHF